MTAGSEAERHTVVFTGPYPGRGAGEYLFLVGDSDRLEREVGFTELPENVRRRVLAAYRDLWDLPRFSR